LKIEYENKKVERYFKDLKLLQKEKGENLARRVKIRLNQLSAADNFNVYYSTQLGKPHPLAGDFKGKYGITLLKNIRLIVKVDTEDLRPESLVNCKTIIIVGVVDYHGGKNELIIS
jgi:proteic killer suppression protein